MKKPSTLQLLSSSRLPERLRGVLLPEISRPSDLAEHTGLPKEWFIHELEAGRLAGLKLVDEWLVHRRAVQTWLRALNPELEEESQ